MAITNCNYNILCAVKNVNEVTHQELRENGEIKGITELVCIFKKSFKDRTPLSQEYLKMVEKMMCTIHHGIRRNLRLGTRDHILIPRETSVKGH